MEYKRVYALIVAAGSGKRMNIELPKQLLPYRGSTVLETSVRKFAEHEMIDDIVVVSPADGSLDKTYYQIMGDIRMSEDAEDGDGRTKDILVVRGGEERSDSVVEGLKAVAEDAESKGYSEDEVTVLIHDAARPGVDRFIIRDCIEAMKECRAVTVAIPSVDSVRMAPEDAIKTLKNEGSYPIISSTCVQRELVYCVQTPQAFVLSDILRAHEMAAEDGFAGTDDASYAEHAGIEVGIVKGTRGNAKITTSEDLELRTRVGNGYDVHKLVPGRDLILCGTPIPSNLGLDGHSDADVATHALMDALLGAAGLGDIGRHFPDTDDRYKGANSLKLLSKVKEMLGEDVLVGNADITIIAQEPKLAPYNEEMRKNIAKTLGISESSVNVKATTEEGLGFTGRGEAIAAFATCTIEGSF